MKKMMTYAALTVWTAVAAFGGTDKVPHHEQKVVDIVDISEEELSAMMGGAHSDLAVQFSKGTRLPIRFYIRGDILNLINENDIEGEIEVMQPFYLRFMDESLQLSFDLIEWKPFIDTVTGAISGEISTINGMPMTTFGTTLHRKK